MNRRACVFLLAIVALLPGGSIAANAQKLMTHHVKQVVLDGHAYDLGRLPAEQTMHLDVVLPLGDPAGLKQFVTDLYDPSTPSYRQFVNPQQFTEKFGPKQQDYDTTMAYVKAQGFAVVGGSRDGMDIQIKGPVSAIETAFHVQMHSYQHPTDNRTFYSPDREPTTDLAIPLWHISGLDNYTLPHSNLVKKGDATANGIRANDTYAGTGSGPGGSYLGSDMRAAYYGGTILTGAGVNMALIEASGVNLTDVNTYYSNIGKTYSVPIVQYSVDGEGITCIYANGCEDGEQVADVTQALGVAPGLASLTLYVGNLGSSMLSALTTHSPLPTTIGDSWGWGWDASQEPYFEKMAAQGQSFFASAGDEGNWSMIVNDYPADDPYVTGVGGTDLVTTGPGGAWSGETAWSSSGGGISPNGLAIPFYQQMAVVINAENQGSTTLRNGPDVAANANQDYYTCMNQQGCATDYGGTSFAAPLWAAYTALINQQLASDGFKPIGFLNPYLYLTGINRAYEGQLNDIFSGTAGIYSATTGYDLVTGWGTPTAQLIGFLSGFIEGTPITPMLQVGTGSWQKTNAVTVNPGTVVNLGPQPTSGGSWNWYGPDGFTSTARQLSNIALNHITNNYLAVYVNSSGQQSTMQFTITLNVSPTPITPHLQVNGGSWQQTNTTTVTNSAKVNLGPQVTGSGGSWLWSGPNGFTSTSREIDNVFLQFGSGINTYNVTYTNSYGLKSYAAFVVTLNCSPGITPEMEYYHLVNGVNTFSWVQTSDITLTSLSQVNLGPQPSSGGSWSWSSGNDFASSSRQVNNIPLVTGENFYTATYTNTVGCVSWLPFQILVQ